MYQRRYKMPHPYDSTQKHYKAVCSAIAAAATANQRDPESIALLAVSKRQSIEKIQALYALGQRAFGENRVQEALVKIAELPSDIVWHFIGQIQSNKTKLIAENFAWAQSVDCLKIAERLNEQRPATAAPLNICICVNVDDEPQKAGVSAAAALSLAQQIKSLERLKLRGIMAIPAARDNPKDQLFIFQQLKTLYNSLNQYGLELDTLSMGMTNDYQAAIAAESTMLRIGTALFGERDAT